MELAVIGIGIAVLLVLLIVGFILMYNRLQRLRVKVEEQAPESMWHWKNGMICFRSCWSR